jgi:small-conductance mechanosensitive channel
MRFHKVQCRLYIVFSLFICLNVFTVENVFSEEKTTPENTTRVLSDSSYKSINQTVLKISNFELWSIDGQVVTVKKAVSSLLIILLGFLIIKSITLLISKRLKSSTRINENTASIIQKIVYYFLIVFVVLFALRILNIPLTAFTFLGGALAIGVGFGTQTLMNNFISGFILLAERPIRVGDLIELDGSRATVEEVGARCTRVKTADNIHILVPNSKFLEQDIINWTLSDKKIRVKITVGVLYGSPVREVERLLLDSAKKHGDVHKNPEPYVRFSDFGDNALIFNLYFWVSMNNIFERLRISSDIRFSIDESFRSAGIVIAFPQRDLHLDTLKPLDIRIMDQQRENGLD